MIKIYTSIIDSKIIKSHITKYLLIICINVQIINIWIIIHGYDIIEICHIYNQWYAMQKSVFLKTNFL